MTRVPFRRRNPPNPLYLSGAIEINLCGGVYMNQGKKEKLSAPFQGITVWEYAGFVAEPYCGKLLADLGADVLKVEAPETGDTDRSSGP